MYRRQTLGKHASFVILIFLFCFIAGTSFAQNAAIKNRKDSLSVDLKKSAAETTFVQERVVPDSIIQQLKNDEDFWYAQTSLSKKEKQSPTKSVWNIFQDKGIRTLFWVLFVVCCIGIIIWFLTTTNFQLFRTKSKKVLTENEVPDHPDIFSIDFSTAINNAIAGGDYGLAVRWLYLQLLKRMADGGVIDYGQQKPNREYLSQLKDNPLLPDFYNLTLDFEYAWYGKFIVSQPMFTKIKSDFQSFEKRLPS